MPFSTPRILLRIRSSVSLENRAGRMREAYEEFDQDEAFIWGRTSFSFGSGSGRPYRAACMFSATACIVLPYSPAGLNSTTSPPSSTTRLCPGSR
jgi:hypothetical protein